MAQSLAVALLLRIWTNDPSGHWWRNIPISLKNPDRRVKTFYKKGCQEKKLRLDRRRDFFLEIQPTEVSTSLEKFGLLFILVSFSAAGDAAVEFKRAASELVASEATMVLSEARGLWLFLVIREGIGCKWVTRCRSTQ